MKILLVFPPMLGEERYGGLTKVGSYLPPLGLLYLASALENKHHIKIIDGTIENITVEDIGKEVETWHPDVVGVCTYTPTLYRAMATLDLVKRINPAILTVLGGPHATACPQDSMKNPNVDVCVVGEGEKTFSELLDVYEKDRNIDALHSVRGILFRKNSEILANPPRERITNLDELPFPARHLIDITRYRPSVLHYKRSPAFPIVCGRGCPFRCTFCSCSKVFKGRVTIRTPENVLEEVKQVMEKYGAKEIMFWDDTFGLYENWTYKLCELIKPLKITWSCWMRVTTVNPEILKKMAESGCWHISYGVESGNQKVLDTIKKHCTLDQIKNAFTWTHNTGMEARGTYILGLPNDTWESMMDTINIAIETKADYAQFQLLTPYPGTELWETATQYGEFAIKDFSKYTIWFPVFVPKGLTQEQLVKAHRFSYRKFYFRPAYIWQRIKSINSWLDVKRYFMGVQGLVEYFCGKSGKNKG